MNNNSVNEHLYDGNFIFSQRKKFDKLKTNYHYHEHCELILIKHGNGKLWADDKEYDINSNKLFLIHASIPHKFKIESDSYTRFIVYFRLKKVKDIFNNNNKKNRLFEPLSKELVNIKLNSQQTNKISSLIKNIILEERQKKEYYRFSIKIYLMKIFLEILRYQKEGSNKNSNYDSRLKKIIYFLNNNCEKDLTLEEIANKFNLSKYYLSHFFKEKTGYTVFEYINRKRIKNSQKFLEESQEKITDIAYEVGFNNLSHFERTFKSLMGVTPSEFREIKNNFK